MGGLAPGEEGEQVGDGQGREGEVEGGGDLGGVGDRGQELPQGGTVEGQEQAVGGEAVTLCGDDGEVRGTLGPAGEDPLQGGPVQGRGIGQVHHDWAGGLALCLLHMSSEPKLN